MLDVDPIVRHMLLCEDVQVNKANRNKLNLFGFTSTLRPLIEGGDARIVSLCVFLQLTELYRGGIGQVIVREDESEVKIYSGQTHSLQQTANPLMLASVVVRVGPHRVSAPGFVLV